MKKMTCNELGGACDLEFSGNTFDEIAEQSKSHGSDMFKNGDPAHLEAMHKMRELMHTEGGLEKWMKEKKELFEAKPEL